MKKRGILIIVALIIATLALVGCVQDERPVAIEKSFDIIINFVQYPPTKALEKTVSTDVVLLLKRKVETPKLSLKIEIFDTTDTMIDSFEILIDESSKETSFISIRRDFAYPTCNGLKLRWTSV